MGRMNLHHIVSYILTELRGFPIGFDDLKDQFPWHFAYVTCRHVDLTGAVCNRSFSDITANGSQTAVHSAVGKLDIGKGSRIVDPAGAFGQALADAEGIQLELFIVGFAGRGVRNGFTVGNYRAAAFGFFFQIRSHLRGHMTFGGDHAGACRCGNDPVFQSQVPDPDRGKKVRVQFLTRVFLGHDRSSSIHVSNRTYCLLVHYRKTASAM